jgi:DNA-nicking Smr family endonuclease
MNNNKLSNYDLQLWKQITKTTIKIPNKSINKTNYIKEDIKKYNKPIDLTQKEITKFGLNKSTERKLKNGNFEIDAKIDLHGLRVIEAEKLLYSFLLNQYSKNNRNILVVSGKGLMGKGVIRSNIRNWFKGEVLSKIIYVFNSAAPKDGGEGAFYVKLRKNKN